MGEGGGCGILNGMLGPMNNSPCIRIPPLLVPILIQTQRLPTMKRPERTPGPAPVTHSCIIWVCKRPEQPSTHLTPRICLLGNAEPRNQISDPPAIPCRGRLRSHSSQYFLPMRHEGRGLGVMYRRRGAARGARKGGTLVCQRATVGRSASLCSARQNTAPSRAVERVWMWGGRRRPCRSRGKTARASIVWAARGQ